MTGERFVERPVAPLGVDAGGLDAAVPQVPRRVLQVPGLLHNPGASVVSEGVPPQAPRPGMFSQ